MSHIVILGVVVIVFLGALTRTMFAFGESVISMPLLALLPVQLHTSISLMGFASLTVALLTTSTGWHDIHRDALISLVLGALMGIPMGLAMINLVAPTIIIAILGVTLVCYGAYSLIQQSWFSQDASSTLRAPRWGILFGFISGLFGSAYNFTGVPVAVYGSLRQWNPEKFRSTMQAYFLTSGTFIVLGQGLNGMWSTNVLILYLYSLPSVAVAFLVGNMIHRRIPTETFQRYVFLLITALGTILCVKSVIT